MRMRIAPLILFVFSVSPAAAGLIANGGFETGDFTGWTVSGGAFDCGGATPGISSNDPHSGTYSACFGNPGTLTFISQTLATVPGQVYLVSFWYAQQPGNQAVANEARVLWGGATIADVTNVSVTPWVSAAFAAAATGASTQLQFGFENVPGWFAHDEVTVDAVPEPGAGVLCAVGLILLPTLLLRRRTRPVRVS